MSTSYYGLNTNAGDIFATHAGALVATAAGSSVVKTTGSATNNLNGFFMRLPWLGGNVTANGALAAPDANGWLFEPTSLEGVTFPSGTWQLLATLFSSDSSATGDLYVRFYKLNVAGDTFIQIGSNIKVAGITIPTGGFAVTATGAGFASVTINTGEKLYVQLDWNQTSGGSATNTISVQVASSSTVGVSGANGGMELVTPFSGPTVTIQATSTIHLHESGAFVTPIIGTDAVHLHTSVTLEVLQPLPTIPPPPMPLISLNAPAYSNATFYAAGNADDGNYSSIWRSVTAPSVGSPQWLAYDLSSVPPAQRAEVLINLINELGEQYLDPAGAFASSLPTNYTIDANAAAGGGTQAPTNGWVNLVTVVGNLQTTMQHAVNLTGYNWVRFQCTAALGAGGNNDALVQMDVHDAHLAVMDRWLVLGDSITAEGQLHQVVGGGAPWGYGGALSQVVAALTAGKYFPAMIDGGNSGQTMAWAAANIAGLLGNFTGGFVVLCFGTNDCLQFGGNFTPGDVNVTNYYAHLLTCIDAAAALNNRVIVPKIPYGYANSGSLGFDANLLNQYVAQHLPTDRPSVQIGPDFWTFYQANQGLLRNVPAQGDVGIHPTYTEVAGAASGYEAMHALYAAWMYQFVYGYSPVGSATLLDANTSGAVTIADLPGGNG